MSVHRVLPFVLILPLRCSSAEQVLRQDRHVGTGQFNTQPHKPALIPFLIGRDLYGDDDIVPYETLLEWRDINDEIFMALKDRGQVVGYSSDMPL